VSIRVSKAAALAAVLVAAAWTGGAGAVVPGVPAIYVYYAGDCTFTVSIAVNGGVVPVTATSAPGASVPPGGYQLVLSMPNPSSGFPCGQPAFTLNGPGVSIRVPFAGVELRYEQLLTLQPSATYVAAEATTPSAPQKFFTTSATGTAGAPPAATTSGSGTGSSQTDIVGSGLPQVQGTLVATVNAAGRATLEQNGRAVARLSPGRFDIVVTDRTRRAGLFLERRGGKPVTLTTLAFVGKSSHVLDLAAGSWTYFTEAGKPVPFVVR
jgi:hypothetical protein